jgi:thiol-disulfide isomerase/thioredoxin
MRILSVTLSIIFVMALSACRTPPQPVSSNQPQPVSSNQPPLTPVGRERVSLLFYHEPNHCPHCAYEMPQIRQFQRSHRDVDVVWRSVDQPLSSKERALLSGTSGHPIMVFWSGEDQSAIVGETTHEDLDQHLAEFLHLLEEARERIAEAIREGRAEARERRIRKKTNSGATCP